MQKVIRGIILWIIPLAGRGYTVWECILNICIQRVVLLQVGHHHCETTFSLTAFTALKVFSLSLISAHCHSDDSTICSSVIDILPNEMKTMCLFILRWMNNLFQINYQTCKFEASCRYDMGILFIYKLNRNKNTMFFWFDWSLKVCKKNCSWFWSLPMTFLTVLYKFE